MAENNAAAAAKLKAALPGCTLAERLVWLRETDSTNDEIKRFLAAGGGGVYTVLADGQTRGRGRRGRSFLSLSDKGLYLSILLTPDCPAEEAGTLTAWAAVAVCAAIESCCGLAAGIKWPNDIVLGQKKLCGILTELYTGPGETGVILGIGLNVSQSAEDFGEELAESATSLAQHMPAVPSRIELAAAVLAELERMRAEFPVERENWLARYSRSCLTVGREVLVHSPLGVRRGLATALGEDFSLMVSFDGAAAEPVRSGEVSVRGLYGYV